MDTRRYSKFLAGLGTSIVLLSLLVNSARAAAGDTTRVSISSGGIEGNDNSGYDNNSISISADGRYVAFQSYASNLVSGDTNGYADIFVHDRQTGQTERVSVATNGTQGNGGSYYPAISADGRYVSFCSDATNLVEVVYAPNVFVHDRQSGETELVSVASDSTQGTGGSTISSISADGRFVAFQSAAINLVSGDTKGVEDVFVHDRQSKQTTLISVGSDGTQGDSMSGSPSISADGRYVAFQSYASNLVSGDTNGYADIFVHDRQTGQTERISVASDFTQGNNHSWGSSISADGRYVSFGSTASNLVGGDTNGNNDIFVHDRQTGQTERISVASDGTQSNNHSWGLSISPDGRYVSFASASSNLVSGDTNDTNDIFVRDTLADTTIRISIDSNDAQGNNQSNDSSISSDGRYVAFVSKASNLVSGDTNGYYDVFVHDLGGVFTAYSISGHVTVSNGKPLPGVQVTVGQGHTTLSDSNGNYAIANLPDGNYTLSVDKRGYTFTTPSIPVALAGINVTNADFIAVLPQWTLAFYLDGDNSLSVTYPPIFNQIEASAGNDGVTITALWDSKVQNDSAYYWIKQDSDLKSLANYVEGEDRWRMGELDMGDPTTLTNYLNWAMDNFPASHYAIILDDHGSGLGGAMQDDTSSTDVLTLSEIQSALNTTVDTHQKIDLLVMNACLMGLVEDGFQFRDSVNYYVASEDGQNAYSEGYAQTLGQITVTTDPKQAAIAFVNGYSNEMVSKKIAYTMSVADLSKVQTLKAAIESLAGNLDMGISVNAAKLWWIRQSQVQKFLQGYIDLYDFAHLIKDNFDDQVIKDDAKAVMDAIQDAYIINNRSSLNNAYGVSIFFPDMQSSYYNGGNYDFALGTSWSTANALNAGGGPLGWGNLLAHIFEEIDPNGLNNPTPPPLLPKPVFYTLYLPFIQR